jgi:hypothetical protein
VPSGSPAEQGLFEYESIWRSLLDENESCENGLGKSRLFPGLTKGMPASADVPTGCSTDTLTVLQEVTAGQQTRSLPSYAVQTGTKKTGNCVGCYSIAQRAAMQARFVKIVPTPSRSSVNEQVRRVGELLLLRF